MVKACQILILASLLLGVVWEGCAQDLARVDSLKRVLEGTTGRKRSEILWELSGEYLDSQDNMLALSCIHDAYELSKQEPVDSLWLVHMGRVTVRTLARLERYNDAFIILDDILPVARRNAFIQEINYCLSAAGRMYSLQGKYDKALLCNLECLAIREKLGDREEVSITENNIGFTYYKVENYSKALEYFSRSLASKQAVGSRYDEDLAYINVGLCYKYLGKTEQALQYVTKALDLCGTHCRDGIIMDGTLALGVLYSDLKQPKLSRENLLRCYKVAVRTGSSRYQAESLVALARQANNSGLYTKAFRHLKESEQAALSANSRTMVSQTYHELFRATKGMKRYADATQYWDKYWLCRDSLFNESLEHQLVSTQVKFEQKRNETRLALQESTVQWQGHQNFWIALIGGLLIIVIELLIYDYTGRKRETQILETLVHDRTRALDQKVRVLERETTEGKAWQDKLDKSLREGCSRLTVLGELIGRDNIKTMLQQFRDLREGQPSE